MRQDDVPLCVDLDGTLIHSDLLVESAFALLRRNPFHLASFLYWLAFGRARLKREIARRVSLDVERLPYDERVLAWLRADAQRPRLLCTASDQRLADDVATHVGGFDEVLASDGVRNLGGRRKAALLRARYGERGFDYAGNAATDLNVWRHARHAIVANAPARLVRRVRAAHSVARVFERRPGRMHAWVRALRIHQWSKNLLLFVPLLAAHRVLDTAALAATLVGFLAFSLCASAAYIVNDLIDLDADRRHPRKRLRPFAAGTLPLSAGLLTAPLFALAAIALSMLLPTGFLPVLLAYGATTLAYSFLLKRIAVLDVLTLAALYTLRIIAGGEAIPVAISSWLLAFSMCLFLGLALVKRYAEVERVVAEAGTRLAGRGYHVVHRMPILLAGVVSSALSVVVLAFYIDSTKSAQLYTSPHLLWLLTPLLAFWLARVWRIARAGRMHDDPVVFALTDRVSLGVLAAFALVVFSAV
jgi:4-hydroxybenzoate polyprenyltransferase